MAAFENIVLTTKALIQALKIFLNGTTNDVTNETPVQVSVYTSAQNRDVSGNPVQEKYPCVAIEGPSPEENKMLRLDAVEAHSFITDKDDPNYLTYKERKYPRYYNLIFRVIIKSNNPFEFLSLQEKVNAFIQATPKANGYQLGVEASIGSLKRPPLTDLLEAAGEIIIRNVKVYIDEEGTQGDLVETVELKIGDKQTLEIYADPEEVIQVTTEE